MKTVFIVICVFLFVVHADADPVSRVVYKSNFQRGPFPEWSTSRTSSTPRGAQKFLGMFGEKSGAMLQLKELPAHKLMRIRCTIFQIYSPDGNSRQWGADPWGITIGGSLELFRTTFSFWHSSAKEHPQSFPDDYPIDHPAATGVSAIGSLGYRYAAIAAQASEGDHTYKLDIAFPHEDADAEIRFWSEYTHGAPDEAWGIADVEVEVISEPIARNEKELSMYWKELLGNDPMRAWNALWRIAECGPNAENFVLRQVGGDPETKEKVSQLVRDLSSKDALAQEKARTAIDNLSASATPYLRAAMADPSIPKKIRDEFVDLVGELKAESPIYTARVSRLLRVLNTRQSREALAQITGGPGFDGMPKGFARLVWQAKHAPIGDPWGMRCAFSSDGQKLITACGDGGRIWDTATGRLLHYIRINNARSVAFSPDKQAVLLGSYSGPILRYNLNNLTMPETFTGGVGDTLGLCFIPGTQKFVSGARDGLRWWDLKLVGPQNDIPIPIGRPVRNISLSPDHKTLAICESGDPGVITLRDAETGEVKQQIDNLPSMATSANFSPDGKSLAISTYNGHLSIYDLAAGKERFSFAEPGPQGEYALFSPDGKYVCFAGGKGARPEANHGLRIYRTADGAEVWRFSNIGNCIGTAFSPNGEYLASMDGNRNVYVWKIAGEAKSAAN